MKIKLGQVLASKNPLIALSQQPLRASVAFKLDALIEEFDPHCERAEKARFELFKKHGELVNGGEQYKVPKEKEEDFYAELQELEEVEVELKDLKIKMFDLGDALISRADSHILRWLIENPFLPADEGEVLTETEEA